MEERIIKMEESEKQEKQQVDFKFKYLKVVEGKLIEAEDGDLMAKEDCEKAMDWALKSMDENQIENINLHIVIEKQNQLIEGLKELVKQLEGTTNNEKKMIIYGRDAIEPKGTAQY